ncbi:recombinase family protein [Subdoligranulum sp. DSM 109015]|uniref:Recombinase family protein n=1 Tax=Gemmiger gallinarum TaxID=2779354 RepID=A0ABR9R6K7_9FIRM|nr:recombinase family protein [Gemmiger gallinarum]MBE5038771.1 recombinase family protein [Gemmiger gallinarum]
MNAVIYARYSSDNQREESIEGQLRECKEYADQNGITVVRTYIDRALSAKTDSRPQFQQMIHDSATHTFEAVLVWKLDRFSRNRYDSAHYKRILKNNRVHVVSVTEPISNTPEGIMLESLLEGMAEYYSAELAEKVSRGHKENALKAKFNGGPVPLGYRIDSEHHYQIDPATAPVVQEAFRRYAAGESIRSIIESLNARGILTPSTKVRMEELEQQREALETSILQEQIEKPPITREQILFWFDQFRHGDPADIAFQEKVIDCFVNSIYLFDDRIVVNFNYQEGGRPVSLEEVLSSFLDGNGA